MALMHTPHVSAITNFRPFLGSRLMHALPCKKGRKQGMQVLGREVNKARPESCDSVQTSRQGSLVWSAGMTDRVAL